MMAAMTANASFSKKKTLVYAPMDYEFNTGLTPFTLPEISYYVYQVELYKWFSVRKDINVVWKVTPSRMRLLQDPIRHRKVSNIRYSTKKLRKELRNADMCFVDYPSTPMFDSINMGVPTLCVTCFDKEFMRDRLLVKIDNLGNNKIDADRVFDRLDAFIKHPTLGMLMPNTSNWIEGVLRCQMTELY